MSEKFYGERKPVESKVGQLTLSSKAVNVTAKVVSKSEVKSVTSGKDGMPHQVCDALVGDGTGCIVLTLWDKNIEAANVGETVRIENGYVSLYRGNMRLNVGRFGKIEKTEALREKVDTTNNLSEKVYKQPFKRSRGYRGYRRY